MPTGVRITTLVIVLSSMMLVPAATPQPSSEIVLEVQHPPDSLVAFIPVGPEPWQVSDTPCDYDANGCYFGFFFAGQYGAIGVYDFEKKNLKLFAVPLKSRHEIRVVPIMDLPRVSDGGWDISDATVSSKGTLYLLVDRFQPRPVDEPRYVIFRQAVGDPEWRSGRPFDPEIPLEEQIPGEGKILPFGPKPELGLNAVHLMAGAEDSVYITVRGRAFCVGVADTLLTRPEIVELPPVLPFIPVGVGNSVPVSVCDEERWLVGEISPGSRFVPLGQDDLGHIYEGRYFGELSTVVRYDRLPVPVSVVALPRRVPFKETRGKSHDLIAPDGSVRQVRIQEDGLYVHAMRFPEDPRPQKR
jgi:hypothetical protein